MQFEQTQRFEQHFNSDAIFAAKTTGAFSELAIDFLSQLSKSLLKDKAAKAYPDLVTFAYFCRRANLHQFKEKKLSSDICQQQFGVGVCLHIAPANIPMNFAFSFIMGLMAGNKNIVRLPSTSFAQIDIFLAHFDRLGQMNEFSTLAASQCFIRTARDSEKLINLVATANALVVWGGDTTAHYFRQLPKKVDCIDVYFPNRRSSLVINSEYLLEQDDAALAIICGQFYNDTYLVDQNACSSPSMIIWLGDNATNDAAKEKFTQALTHYIPQHYQLTPGARIERLRDVMGYCQANGDKVAIDEKADALWFIQGKDYQAFSPKLGVFIEHQIKYLSQLPILLRENEQSLTYLGVKPAALRDMIVEQQVNTLDRIVPMGQALDIGFVWDGKNMIYTLSKCITIT